VLDQLRAVNGSHQPGAPDSLRSTGIVGDDHNPSPGRAAGGAELLEKLKEAGSIEFAGFQTEHKAPIAQAHGPEIAHTLAGGGMQEDRVLDFWRGPHAAARAVLLKVHLVGRPKIDAVIMPQVLAYFYVLFELRDWPGPERVVACANGSRVDETYAGTGEPRWQCHTFAQSRH